MAMSGSLYILLFSMSMSELRNNLITQEVISIKEHYISLGLYIK